MTTPNSDNAQVISTDPKNANKGTQRGRALLLQSLRELGAGRSILLDKDGNIIAGNKTFEAAKEAGIRVRVVEADRGELVAVQRTDLDLTNATGEARRLAYLDNRVGELDLDWDPEQILKDLELGLDLQSLGFDESELLIFGRNDEDDEIDAEPQLDKAEELQQIWNTQLGQVWALGNHRLICGDCTSGEVVKRAMAGRKFNLLCTDPPYGVNVKGGDGGEMTIANDSPEDLRGLLPAAFSQAKKYAEKKAAFYIAAPHGPQFHEFSTAILAAKMEWRQTLVWAKNNIVLGRSDYQQKHEVFFYGNFGAGRKWNGGRKQTTVITERPEAIRLLNERQLQITIGAEIYIVEGDNLATYQVEPDLLLEDKPQKSELHPTMKPVRLIRRFIRNSSERGDLVYEPFSGSGTTILACENDQRRCVAIELLPKYIAVDLQRWADATGRSPLLVEE